MIRSILGIVLGIVLAMVVIFAIQGVGMLVYTPPAGMDWQDRQAMAAHIANMSPGQFAFLLASYALGTLAGAWLVATVARRRPVLHGLVLGGFFLLGNIVNLSSLPHPLWFVVVTTLLFLPLAVAGARLAARPA